jgi:uncharacterized membrane protein
MALSDNRRGTRSGFLRNVRRTFLTGLIVVIPGAVIGLGVIWLFNLVDGVSQPVVRLLFGRTITGLGIVVTLVIVSLAGIFVSNAIGRKIVQLGESLVKKLPVLGQMYSGFKQVAESLGGAGAFKAAFREVVLVEYPTPGVFTIAYITNELKDLSGERLISVYLPTAPTPQTGVWAMVSRDQIFDTDLTMEQSIEMTVSAGLLTPERIMMRRRSA